MTMRIATIAPARARIKMIANSSRPCNTPEAAGFCTDGHYTRDWREEFSRGGFPRLMRPSGAPRWRFSASLTWRASWNLAGRRRPLSAC